MTANPTLLSMPLAQNGQKNVIPETQATAGNGLFSQSTGFPAETSLPLGAGGVAPSREDFNGMANLLGGVAFMAQKGFTFNYAATQDYYTGCVVIDPDDGLRYVCVADMAAGTIAPHSDTANTYWEIFKSGLDREQIPAINHRDVITTSGTYTAPVTGWYKITVVGGGGGGNNAVSPYPGGGGGGGGITTAYEYLAAGDSIPVVIGAGGAANNDGGDSSVTVGGNTYTGGKGKHGPATRAGGDGGAGNIPGASGGLGCGFQGAYNVVGGNGGWPNGGTGGSTPNEAGTSGSAGWVWFEYFSEV